VIRQVPPQGYGRAMARVLRECRGDVVVTLDCDGTYPAEAVRPLLAPILEGSADITIGARRPVAQPGAMTPVRGLGNFLIRNAFRLLIGPGPSDLLSGYRVFNRRFRDTVQLRASGFEIEAELASEAIARKMRVVEVPVPYYPRIAGSSSKLKAFRDGWRILRTIVAQSVRLRPWRIMTIAAILTAVAALAAAAWPLATCAAALAGAALAIRFVWPRNR